MSASREKKKRQELLSTGTTDSKAARAAEQRAAERRSNILYGVVAGLFVVVAVALLVYNSGIIQRRQTAVTIGGESYTVPETSFYYQQAYQGFLNSQNGYLYAALGMLDTSASLKSQNYTDDQTWDEFFKEQAVETMRFVHAVKSAAQAEGMALDDEDMASFDEAVQSMKSSAAQAGYTYGSYLSAVYGATMTTSIYEECVKDQLLVSKYATTHADENFTFTDEEVQAYYDENKNNFDLVNAEYVTISGAPESKTDGEGNTVEPTDGEKTAAMDKAKGLAEDILPLYQTSHSLPQDYDESASYTANEEMRYSAGVLGDWLFDSARKAGDAEILVDEENSRCYVAVFRGRERSEDLDYSVRHILITGDSLELPEGETATEEQLRAKAQEILDSWDGTEDGFASLAEEHSKDGGSNTNGGLYENVPKGRMIAAFQDWCYESGRKTGDTGIVYDSSTGAHIMYFVGYGDTPYWYYACETELFNAAYSKWQSEMTNSVTAEVKGGMNAIG